MQAAEIYNLLRLHESSNNELTLRKTWSETLSVCKDAVALALPMKPLPHTLEAFRTKVASSVKQSDFVIANFYIVYVGRCDGQAYGWSKAPYDSKNKQRQEQKALYTLDSSGEYKDQTRFWSFQKVSNNMNKGARVEQKEGETDLSFVLQPGTCLSFFLREDNYDAQKNMFEGAWDTELGVIDPYAPVLLQLSGTNDDQTLKGNGLKLRRVVPAPREIVCEFSSCFLNNCSELQLVQNAAAECVSLKAMSRPTKRCPLLCQVNSNAFVYKDPNTGTLELVDSGMDQNAGQKLFFNEQILLKALHCSDVDRALRMFSVAIGHDAVRCIYVQDEGTDSCSIIYLQVQMPEAFLFNVLQRCKAVECPTTLPKTSMLTMCFGKPIGDSPDKMFPEQECNSRLQWYSPSTFVQVATADSREVRRNIVFEMDMNMRQSAGQREVANKVLLMDEVAGFHYVIKVFHSASVVYTEENGLECTQPTLLITWQYRPGLVSSTLAVAGVQRKRMFMGADTLDLLNSGELVSRIECDSMLLDDGKDEVKKRSRVSFKQ